MKLWYLARGLAFAAAVLGCSAEEALPGCYKDTDCAEGRICEDNECTWVPGEGGGASSGQCAEAGEACSVNADCCGFGDGGALCVDEVCAGTCASETDCVSSCCATLASGAKACAPASVCDKACSPAGEPCTVNADCCSFRDGAGYCVDNVCADTCDAPEDCHSLCCATLESEARACAPEYVCQ